MSENPSITIGFYDMPELLVFMDSVWNVANGLHDGSILASEGATALYQALSAYERAGLGMNRPDAPEPERE